MDSSWELLHVLAAGLPAGERRTVLAAVADAQRREREAAQRGHPPRYPSNAAKGDTRRTRRTGGAAAAAPGGSGYQNLVLTEQQLQQAAGRPWRGQR